MTSRTKGAAAEREVAVLLQDWWRRRDPVCRFVRTPLSGGWHGAGDFRAAGDLMTTSPEFPLCVEVKRREGWAPSNVAAGRRSPAWGWWDQALRQAREAKLIPALVMRQSRRPWCIMLPTDLGLPWPEGVIHIPETAHSVRPGTGGAPVLVMLADLLSIDPGRLG